MTADVVAFLESLPQVPLYGLITALAALENVFPPVPADTAVALGAFLAGRGIMNPWAVFALTWTANVGSGAAVYAVARRYGPAFFRGRVGRRLLSQGVLQRIEREYDRHGAYGIFLARLLPIWRGVVMPFAGVARVSAPRALIPLALASAVYYGVLIVLIATLGTNLDDVLRAFSRVNAVLGAIAVTFVAGLAFWLWTRARRRLAPTSQPAPDTPGVAVPPPFYYAVPFLAGLLLERAVPTTILPRPFGALVGWTLVGMWAVLLASGFYQFLRARTSPVPVRPASALIVRGPYRFSRNPLYLGLAALYAGLALVFGTAWSLGLLPAAIYAVNRWVIAREEAYLERRFGDAYRAYRARVRRWL